MKLTKAHIYCATCGKNIGGDGMSNPEDAISFVRTDHMRNTGHWADGEVSTWETTTDSELAEEAKRNERPKRVPKPGDSDYDKRTVRGR